MNVLLVESESSKRKGRCWLYRGDGHFCNKTYPYHWHLMSTGSPAFTIKLDVLQFRYELVVFMYICVIFFN